MELVAPDRFGLLNPTVLTWIGSGIVIVAVSWFVGTLLGIRAKLATNAKDLKLSQYIIESLDEETQQRVIANLKEIGS